MARTPKIHVRKRSDGRWEARFELPGSTRASRAQKSTYDRTRSGAYERAIRLLNEVLDGVDITTPDPSVGAYLRQWLDTKRSQVTTKTWERYESIVRTHLTPGFNGLKMSGLSPQIIRNYYRNREQVGCAARSIKQHHAVLSGACQQAVEDDLIRRNPVRSVRPPKIVQRPPDTYSRSEVTRLLGSAKAEPLHALFVLAVSTGLRLGEITGLKWSDLDIKWGEPKVKRGTVQVTRSISWNRSGVAEEKQPKTASSLRLVSFGPSVITALRLHKATQLQQRMAFADVWEDNDYVFCTRIGTAINPGNFYRSHWYPLVRKAGLKRLTFHGLRHTAATLAGEQGQHPRSVASMLGHSSVKTTLDMYTSFTEKMRESLTATMEEVVAG